MNFDNKANIWDSEYRKKRAEKVADEISKSVSIDKNLNAMEFGCGTGLIGLNLINKLKSIHFVDNSQGMLDVLKTKMEKGNITNGIIDCIDIYKEHDKLPKFDLIFTSMALHHMPNVVGLLEIFYNKLTDKGQLCIVDLNKESGHFHADEKDFKGHDGFEQEWLNKKLNKMEYKNIKSYTFLKDKRNKENKEVPYSLFILTAEKLKNTRQSDV